ncbi:MAG: hypothetical protein QF918_08870 [Pirellulaceae bacterium]|nr:hypothetical protein [Pirellulaceae bacterium]
MKFARFMLSSMLITLVVLAMGGCDNAKLKSLADKARNAATKGTESIKEKVTDQVDSASTEVQETLQMAGEITLTLDSPIETNACYARFVEQGSKRPTVFELRSYSSPDKEEFPAVFFHSQIRATTAAELSGQVVSGRLFVQPVADGPTWYSLASSPVELRITSIEDRLLTAEIVSASLQNTQTGASTDVTGSFNAVR